ncbi:MAG: InlB B-repeat-containing protein [Lachnospiraceae bacterium]|nr:InlB B-repeat-containing protein [Lachnospiraceae bacterium]
MRKKGLLFGLLSALCIVQVGNSMTVWAKEDTKLQAQAEIFQKEQEVSKTSEQEETVANITFHAGEGTFANGSKKMVKEFTLAEIVENQSFPRDVCYKYPLEKFPIPVLKGYSFHHYVDSAGNIVYSHVKVREGTYEELTPTWKMDKYSITYKVNGGEIIKENGVKILSYYNVTTPDYTLPKAQRKGYHFGGWYTNASFNGEPITKISKGSAGNLNLYAKWISAAPENVKFASVKVSGSKITAAIEKKPEAKSYEVVISKKSNFPKNVVSTYCLGKKTKLTIPGIAKGTYYIKARAYGYDDMGNKCWGRYGTVEKVVVSGSVKQYKATATSAKITSAKAESQEVVTIKANVSKEIKSSDDFYYLVKVNPYDGKPANPLAKVFKGKKIVYHLDAADKVNVVSKFAIAVKQGNKYKVISKAVYLSNPEKAAPNQMAYVQPLTKKGIHGADDSKLNAKNTMINFNLAEIVSTKGSGEAYVYNGKTYYFKIPHETKVKNYVADKVSVTAMIYLPWSDADKNLIYPSGREKGYYYYMPNTKEENARETLEAVLCCLGETFGREDCYVSHWVVCNEVNSQKNWNHVGNLSLTEYSKAYAQFFQMASSCMKSSYANTRIFIPVDNAWNIPVSRMGWNGKTFVAQFHKALKQESPNTKWNLAYHAYSFPLTNTAYASDQYVNSSSNSPYVSMKNIEVLTNYIKKTYGSKTRIILSEQGYTASLGEDKQAASIAYGYYKAEFNPMIDAYIIRAMKDLQSEIDTDGLAMGLSAANGKHRQAYTVFRYMDTEDGEKYTKSCLKTIGVSSWKKIIPGYNKSRFKNKK